MLVLSLSLSVCLFLSVHEDDERGGKVRGQTAGEAASWTNRVSHFHTVDQMFTVVLVDLVKQRLEVK